LNSIPPWKRPELFGCPVDAVSMTEAVAWVDARVAERTPVRVGAVNAAKLVKIERDPDLARAVTGCELIVADGMSVVWAARLLTGVGLTRVAGIDLMEGMVARAAERGHRVYFLGARQEVLDRMLEVLQARYPGLQVAGSHHGYFHPDEEPALVEAIRVSRPDLLFVAMGTPAKEYWINRNYRTAGAAVSMGVGGSFDVISGLVRRAPTWMQNLGLEWLFRLLQEPGRLWRRYLTTSAVFVGEVLVRAFKRSFVRSGTR
jgi:N-acetylglucosaminyldiphosphoundecaprenol N-acetyl-beta-D-mannosaminyltransferase